MPESQTGTAAPVKVGHNAPLPPQPDTPAQDGQTVSGAIAEIRGKLARGESIIPEEEPNAVSEREAEAVDVEEQAGDGGEVGEGGEAADGRAVEEEEQPAAEAGEGEGGEEGVEEKPKDGEEADIFTVKLPPRRQGENAQELDLEGLDDELKEGFRRLMNEGIRRDQLDSAMEGVRAAQAEVQDVLMSMEADPINFIYERTTPELRTALARHILSDPAVYEAVVPELARWDRSEETRDAARASLERDRVIAQRDAEVRLAKRARSRENAAQIHDKVKGMVPEEAPEHIQELFVDQAMRVLQQYAQQHRVDILDLNQIEPILSQTHVLRLLEATNGVRVTPHPTDPSSAGPAKGAAPDKSLREAQETAERFRTTSVRKRTASAVAPPGVGPAPVQPPEPPEEARRSVRDSIRWYRKNVLGR